MIVYDVVYSRFSGLDYLLDENKCGLKMEVQLASALKSASPR